jgi:hypothetical protein
VAFNAGGESGPSWPECTRPAAPTNLTASMVDGSIMLTWTDNSAIETAYQVWYSWEYRCGSEWRGDTELLAVLPANSTSYLTYPFPPDCYTIVFTVAAYRGDYGSGASVYAP